MPSQQWAIDVPPQSGQGSVGRKWGCFDWMTPRPSQVSHSMLPSFFAARIVRIIAVGQEDKFMVTPAMFGGPL